MTTQAVELELLRAAAAELSAAAWGTGTAIAEDWAKRLSISKGTLLKRLKTLGFYDSGRKTRADKGKLSISEDVALQAAGLAAHDDRAGRDQRAGELDAAGHARQARLDHLAGHELQRGGGLVALFLLGRVATLAGPNSHTGTTGQHSGGDAAQKPLLAHGSPRLLESERTVGTRLWLPTRLATKCNLPGTGRNRRRPALSIRDEL